MISTYKYQGITWVDLESPTEDELIHIISEYNVPDSLQSDLIIETLTSKVELYKDMAYLILHFPRIHNEKRMADLEIDFLLSKNLIITIHYEFSNAIYDFSRNLEVEAMLSKPMPMDHAGDLFHALIIECYKQASAKLDDTYKVLENIKSNIFAGSEDKMVNEISHLNRKMLDFKQALRFHDGIWKSFEKVGVNLYGEKYIHSIESMRSEEKKVSGILEGHREMLLDLRETNDSLLSAKTNKTMRVLTMMSFTTFPLVLLATIILIAVDMGLMQSLEQFIYSMTLIVLMGILIILYFKKRKWLL